MRYLAGIGAIVFVYLALIPIALLGSTLDSACSGSQCETGLLSDIVFTALYASCVAGLLAVAATFGLYAVRPSIVGEGWIVRALIGTAVAIGLTSFALVAITSPLTGAVTAVVGIGGYSLLRRTRDAARRPDPSSNGTHPELNGHGRLNGNSGG